MATIEEVLSNGTKIALAEAFGLAMHFSPRFPRAINPKRRYKVVCIEGHSFTPSPGTDLERRCRELRESGSDEPLFVYSSECHVCDAYEVIIWEDYLTRISMLEFCS